MLSHPEAELICAVRGRTIKFTPERLEQIKNLVERGMTREDIAATIGVTLGSLQVTCSRLGISLRRPKAAPTLLKLATVTDDKPKPEGNGGSTGVTASISQQPQLALVLRRGDHERRIELVLPDDVITRIALDAAMSNESFAAVVARLIIKGDKKD